jgi:regulator of sigma E protease
VSREETVREIKYQPAYEGNVLQIQFALEVEGKMVTPRGFGEASVEALKKAASVFSSGIKSIFDILRGKDRLKTTVVGTFAASTSIGEMTAAGFQDSFSKGMRVILYLLGAVSTSLAIANLLPIPSLDGGLILLSFVELIKGRNASPKVYIICQVLGFAVVLLIVLLLQFAS